MERARRDIETETRRAISEIRQEVADLTVMATEKVTRKTLTEACFFYGLVAGLLSYVLK